MWLFKGLCEICCRAGVGARQRQTLIAFEYQRVKEMSKPEARDLVTRRSSAHSPYLDFINIQGSRQAVRAGLDRLARRGCGDYSDLRRWDARSMRELLLTAALAFLPGAVSAQRPELLVTMGHLSVNGGIAEQAVVVKNNSGRTVMQVWIECGFLAANGTLLSEGLASITNLRPEDIKYALPKTPHGEGATRAICRVSSVRY
jgi:hypothetical protein